MIRYDMIWHGMISSDMIWSDIWHDQIRSDKIWSYKMDCVCQRYRKECSTRTCVDDCYNVRPWFHGWYGFTKWLPPLRKGRITCLWIKSVFDCLTIGIIHETMVVHMTWVWTFFNNYIYIYKQIWYDQIWYGQIWSDMIWSDMVWSDMI